MKKQCDSFFYAIDQVGHMGNLNSVSYKTIVLSLKKITIKTYHLTEFY